MADNPDDPSRAALYKGMEERRIDEYARLHIQHILHKDAIDGKLIQVPLSTTTPVYVLDSATGDGRWMLEAADMYPNATFVGTDIFPQHFEQLKSVVPADRISFKLQSVLEPWPAEDHGKYDLVHQRFCFAAFKTELSAKATKGLFECVKPGGYIQLIDGDLLSFDGDNDKHKGMADMMAYMGRALPQGGMNPTPGRSLKEWLEAAGAVDVHARTYDFGMGARARSKEKKMATTKNVMGMIDNFEAIGRKTPDYFYSQEDFDKLRQTVSHELDTVGNTWRTWIVTAKRPA